MTPLKKLRINNNLRLSCIVDKLKEVGITTDTGNLSRIERGLQTPSIEFAEAIAKIFPELTEMHVLYPDRYYDNARVK